MKLSFKWGEVKDTVLEVVVDSDWAGCPKTRCSTSGGVMKYSGMPLKHWPTSQPTISLSSAEAEAKAITTGCIAGIYAKSLLEGLTGEEHHLEIHTDSSSAKSIAQRRGPGRRAKHLEVQTMWVQQLVKQGIIKVVKVATEDNEADPLTKYVPRGILEKLSWNLGFWWPDEVPIKAQAYDKMSNHYWGEKQQKRETQTNFEDEEQEEQRAAAKDFEDKTAILTMAILRRGVKVPVS